MKSLLLHPVLVAHFLSLPWLGWEFVRRYDGRRPLRSALALTIPFVAWIVAFPLFRMSQLARASAQRGINRNALMCALSALLLVALLLGAVAVLGGSIWVVGEGRLGIGVLLALLALAVFGAARAALRFGKRCRSGMDPQE